MSAWKSGAPTNQRIVSKRAFRVFLAACVIAYLLLLIQGIIFKYPEGMVQEILNTWSLDALIRHIQMANLIPFRTISSSLFNTQLSVEIPTLIYNMIAFMPLGFLLPCLIVRARKLKAVLLAGLVVSLILELVQTITRLGTPDIDDIILNVTGAAVGYAVYKFVSRYVTVFD